MSSIPATIVSFVALPLGIIGWSIPYWEYGENGLTKAYLGLWEYCLKISFNYMESYTCIKLDSQWTVTPSMNAVRALVILGSIMQCFALVCSIVKLCVKKEQQKLFKAAGGFALFSGLLMMIGIIVFAAKTREDPEYIIATDKKYFDLHASFGLCIVSSCLAIIAGILFLLDKKRQPPHQSYIAAQPGAMSVHAVHSTAGYSAGYSAGAPGVILSPPPYYSNPAVSSGGPSNVRLPPPSQGMPH